MGFAQRLVAWAGVHGRRGLPWQATRDPYRVWLSEVMLQQTQVAAVIPYYERFLARYPDVQALAAASEEEVLRLWSGLGYYARGRNLLAAARVIAANGFPRSAEAIARLPGIGRSTAAAIAAFCFGERAAILDGNVKRVLSRHRGIAGFPGDKAVEAKLWEAAERFLPRRDVAAYTQAMMDLGATVCTRTSPRCGACPVAATCFARKRGLTAELPSPRPPRELPSKRTTWIVLRCAGRVLLERRPSPGIWGGLWVFPEREVPGVVVGRRSRLDPIEHAFTHFRLTIQPVLCDVPRLPPKPGEPGLRWFSPDAASEAAVPAPVRSLLRRLPGAPGSARGAPRRRRSRAAPA